MTMFFDPPKPRKCYACQREIPVCPAELEAARIEAEGLAYLRKRLSDEGSRPEDYTAGLSGWSSEDQGKTCKNLGWRAEVKRDAVTYQILTETVEALGDALVSMLAHEEQIARERARVRR